MSNGTIKVLHVVSTGPELDIQDVKSGGVTYTTRFGSRNSIQITLRLPSWHAKYSHELRADADITGTARRILQRLTVHLYGNEIDYLIETIANDPRSGGVGIVEKLLEYIRAEIRLT